jgi:hypothetical protein
MGKNGRNKRVYAAKTKALRKIAQEGEPQKLLASNEMITKVVDKDFVGLLKMKLLSNGLLNVSLDKRDMRIPMYVQQPVVLLRPVLIKQIQPQRGTVSSSPSPCRNSQQDLSHGRQRAAHPHQRF